jgi:hypothetical protein
MALSHFTANGLLSTSTSFSVSIVDSATSATASQALLMPLNESSGARDYIRIPVLTRPALHNLHSNTAQFGYHLIAALKKFQM